MCLMCIVDRCSARLSINVLIGSETLVWSLLASKWSLIPGVSSPVILESLTFDLADSLCLGCLLFPQGDIFFTSVFFPCGSLSCQLLSLQQFLFCLCYYLFHVAPVHVLPKLSSHLLVKTQPRSPSYAAPKPLWGQRAWLRVCGLCSIYSVSYLTAYIITTLQVSYKSAVLN